MNVCWRGILMAWCCASVVTAQEWLQQITGTLTVIDSIAVDDRNNCFVSGVAPWRTG